VRQVGNSHQVDNKVLKEEGCKSETGSVGAGMVLQCVHLTASWLTTCRHV